MSPPKDCDLQPLCIDGILLPPPLLPRQTPQIPQHLLYLLLRAHLVLLRVCATVVLPWQRNQIDEYVYPSKRSAAMRLEQSARFAPIALNEEATPHSIEVTQEGTGEVVEVREGVRMRF